MNPTCRRPMRYRTPCLMPCRYDVTDPRDPPGAPWPEKSPSIRKRMSIRQKEQPPMLSKADTDRRERIHLPVRRPI
jgi:hypothetical protein